MFFRIVAIGYDIEHWPEEDQLIRQMQDSGKVDWNKIAKKLHPARMQPCHISSMRKIVYIPRPAIERSLLG